MLRNRLMLFSCFTEHTNTLHGFLLKCLYSFTKKTLNVVYTDFFHYQLLKTVISSSQSKRLENY